MKSRCRALLFVAVFTPLVLAYPSHAQSAQVQNLIDVADGAIEEGDLDKAIKQLYSAIATAETLGDHSGEGLARASLGRLLFETGDLPSAETELRLAIEHLDADQLLNDLAFARLDMAYVAQANVDYEEMYQQSGMASDLLDDSPDSNARVEALNAFALASFLTGRFREARQLYQRALDIASHEEDIRVIYAGMAVTLHQFGEFVEARRYYEQVVALVAPESIEEAVARERLAFFLADLGDWQQAEIQYSYAIEIREALIGADDPALGITLVNLASVQAALGDVPGTRESLSRAIGLTEGEPLAHARVNRSLAQLDLQEGNTVRAIRRLEFALATLESTLESSHPNVAAILVDLAVANAALSAEDRHRDPLILLEQAEARYSSISPVHPDLIRVHQEMADLHRSNGTVYGWHHANEAARLTDILLQQTGPTLSVAEQYALAIEALRRQTGIILSHASTPSELADGYAILSRWKGLTVESLRRQRIIASSSSESDLSSIALRLDSIRTAIASHVRTPSVSDREQWRRHNARLTEAKEALERQLFSAQPNLVSDWPPDPIREASEYLHPDEAFVDIYKRDSCSVSDNEYCYTAILVFADGTITGVELGSARPIETAVANWRAAVIGGRPALTETNDLAGMVWRPLQAVLPPNIRRVRVSPDAQLARLPWSSFSVPGELLVAEIANLQGLFRSRSTVENNRDPGRLVVVGNVDFGKSEDGIWEPLPATRREAEVVRSLARGRQLGVTSFSEQAAIPSLVSAALVGARFAHIATHGFFDDEHEIAKGTRGVRRVVQTGSNRLADRSRNPLSHSGLALSNANIGSQGNLTAEELITLDLSGLEMIVLSACDTGRGLESNGQGVLGLRASLEAAGAQTLLMSLWKVPDESTALLMEHFYLGIWSDELKPAESLLRAQEILRADVRYSAPLHWAAWSLSGSAW